MRTKLKIGQQITLICDGNEKTFTINKVIGDGASCIAYDASHTNSWGATEYYRIKECYPYHANITRHGDSLTWANQDEKNMYFERFKQSYLLISQLKSEETVGNNITSTMLSEGNGTLYSVMDVNHATVYSKDNSTQLEKILETMLVLTKIVGSLHNKGYLHLDIKPDNFLVSYEPTTNIWLFDVDSLTSVEEINNGTIKTTPYSFSYAAPEQKFGEISKISYATDIYAIGAILFEKVMGRVVSVDDIGMFTKWDFDSNPLFNSINPKAKGLVKTIFKKTLTVSPKQRYKNANELVVAITEALKIANEKTFIVSNIPANAAHFIGRETEIAAIHNEFKLGQKAVFIHGFGGIGKSSLATAYANRYANSYDTAIFLKYKSSLKELLNEINIQNFDGDGEAKIKLLPKLLDRKSLLIIDNFDIEIDQDDYLDELLQFNTNILFTTRTDFTSVYGEDTTQIDINTLSDKEIIQLFTNISGIHNKEDEILNLVKLVDGHTYAVELLALQIAASGCSIEELYNKVSNGLDELYGAEKIRTRKDGRITKRTIPEIIRTLFNVAELDDERKQVLMDIYLLKFLYIDKNVYREFTKASSSTINALNDLVELGWVRISYNIYYSLHPLIEDLVEKDLTPTDENCVAIYDYVKKKVDYCINYFPHDDAEEFEFENVCKFLCVFFESVNLQTECNLVLLMKWLLGLIDNVDTHIETPRDIYFKKIYDKLLAEESEGRLDSSYEYLIRYIILAAWLTEYGYSYFGSDEYNQERTETREIEFNNAYTRIIFTIANMDEDSQVKCTKEVCELLWSNYRNLPVEFLQELYSSYPEYADIDSWTKEWLGFPLSAKDIADRNKEIQDIKNYRSTTSSYTKSVEQEKWDDYIESLEIGFQRTENKASFIDEIYHNNHLKAHVKDELLDEYSSQTIESVANSILNNHDYLEDLNNLKLLLKTRELIRSSEEFIESRKFEKEDSFSNVLYNYDPNKTIDPHELIDELYMDRAYIALFESDRVTFEQNLNYDTSLTYWLKPSDIRFPFDINSLLRICFKINKCHYILPYIVAAVFNYDKNYDEHHWNYDDDREIIYVLSDVRDAAERAMDEVEENSDEYNECNRIYKVFSERINRITGKIYSFKDEIETLGGEFNYDDEYYKIESTLSSLYAQKFFDSNDKIGFVNQLANNEDFSIFERARRIHFCIHRIFSRFYWGISKDDFYKDYDWDVLEQILDIEEELLTSDDCELSTFSEHDDWNRYIELNTINQIITYAASNQLELYESSVALLLSDLKRDCENQIEHDRDWLYPIDFRWNCSSSLSRVINSMEVLKKRHLILPYIIDITEKCQAYLQSINELDERAWFANYKRIAELAFWASIEKNIPNKYQLDFSNIEYEFQDKMDQFSETSKLRLNTSNIFKK